jgi:hypothetical protein
MVKLEAGIAENQILLGCVQLIPECENSADEVFAAVVH